MQWEYRVISKGMLQELEKALNKLGKEGWELVGVTHSVGEYVFKRRKA